MKTIPSSYIKSIGYVVVDYERRRKLFGWFLVGERIKTFWSLPSNLGQSIRVPSVPRATSQFTNSLPYAAKITAHSKIS